MRALITGATGFAGRHLAALCEAAGDEVVPVSRATGVDLTDGAAARAAVAAARPDVVYHLAARAHVGASWREPAAFLRDNAALALNVLEAVRAETPEAVVVMAGSGEVYGPPERLPVTEDAPLRPQNPYAVSKASADLLAGLYADAHGLRAIRARAFNHAGPGQEPDYAIASFCRQVAGGATRIVTGNPDTRRDYTDVRDVVRAYRLLAEHGEPGIYNVCSGRTASAAELVAMLGAEQEVDPALVRGHEVMEVRGSPERVRAATGWAPEIPLERTLADTVAWWRERVLRARGPVLDAAVARVEPLPRLARPHPRPQRPDRAVGQEAAADDHAVGVDEAAREVDPVALAAHERAVAADARERREVDGGEDGGRPAAHVGLPEGDEAAAPAEDVQGDGQADAAGGLAGEPVHLRCGARAAPARRRVRGPRAGRTAARSAGNGRPCASGGTGCGR